jgi:hypothetical protein
MDSKFDVISKETISNLEREFGHQAHQFDGLNSTFSIGIEIEVKFKYFFPELHKKYFSNIKEYLALEYAEKTAIKTEISSHEKELLEKLHKTVDCGIPHGLDRYWEFAINPSHNVSLLCQQVDVLNQSGLLPKGLHSLHINIGDIKHTPRMYWVLMALELIFCTKERIKSGFSDNFHYMSASWAKKGDGGILVKNYNDLKESEFGIELRTLQFSGSSHELYEILKTLCFFISGGDTILTSLKKESLSLGLPNSNFGKPHTNPEVWKKYIDNFDYLSKFIKSIKSW